MKLFLLDRDGVINRERGDYTWLPEHLEILPHVVPNLLKLQGAGFQFAVITNQSGIAKGLYGNSEVNDIHNRIASELEKEGIEVLAWYFCPHHPDFGRCLCRKPGSLNLEKACARFGANKAQSWYIGDRDRDISAGQAAGLNTIKIESNEDWSPYINALLNQAPA